VALRRPLSRGLPCDHGHHTRWWRVTTRPAVIAGLDLHPERLMEREREDDPQESVARAAS